MRASTVLLLVLVVALVAAVFSAAQTRAPKPLAIYVVDVEGGNATLFIPPSGESLLIDTGNAAAAAPRDAGRIIEAMKDAGVQQIDHLITTHWHGDHFGGMAELASHVTIKEFIDHGGNVQPAQPADDFLQKTYPQLYGKAKHSVPKPGDKVPVAGLDCRIVASAGEHINSPLSGAPGAGKPNPYCSSFTPQEVDKTENAQSVGSHITFGKFRVLHLG